MTLIIILIVIIVAAAIIVLLTGRVKIGRGESMKMDLIKLENANDAQIAQFAEIMARPENTRALGTGESWTRDKVAQFVEHARADAAAGNCEYMHWLIILGDAVAGYVSLRPYTAAQSQFRYVIDPPYRGRGYAKWAISQLARPGHWFVVDPANVASINVARAAGAKPAGFKFIAGKKYNLYKV